MKLTEQAEDKFTVRTGQKEEYDPFLDCKFTTWMIDERTGRAWHYNREHKRNETVGTYLQREIPSCTFKWNRSREEEEKEEEEETRCCRENRRRIESPLHRAQFRINVFHVTTFPLRVRGKEKKISFLQSEKAGVNFKVEAEFFERRHVSSDENERKNISPPVHCVHFACNVRAPFKPFSFLFHA